MKKYILICIALFLAAPMIPTTTFAQEAPVEWVLHAGGKSTDYAGGVHIALADGAVRFAATMGEAGASIGDVYETPDAQTAVLVQVDPATGKPIAMYTLSADDLKSSVEGLDVTVNSENDPHLAGTYKGSVGVFQHDLSLLQSPDQSVYLAEFTEKGTISWINTIGSIFDGSPVTFGGIDSHQEGLVYMTGSLTGTEILFFHQTGVETVNTSTSTDEDAYLVQYGTRGELQDLLLMQGNGDSRGNDVSLSKAGSTVYWGGQFNSIATLGRTTLEATGRSQDGFLIKFAGQDLDWIMQVTGEGDVSVSHVAFDPDTNGGYFAGTYEGDELGYELDGVFITSFQTSGSAGSYVGAFNEEGKILWIHFLSGDATVRDLGYREGNPDQPAGVTLSGSFGKEALYTGPNTAFKFGLQGNRDGFLMDLDAAGDLLLLPWTPADTGGGIGHDQWIDLMACCSGASNGVGTATFDAEMTLAKQEVESVGSTDVLVYFYNSKLSPPLPVELTFFTGLVDGTDAILQWETASETNNAGFEVQHLQPDGWQQLGFVAGAGTTTEVAHYAYTASDLSPGQHRFRLKQIDFDGTFAFSPEVTVAVQVGAKPQLIDAYPNPFKPRTTIRFSVPEPGPVSVKVYDVMGRLVANLVDAQLGAGVHDVAWDASGTASGVYFYRMQVGAFVESKRITLLQ